MKTNAKTLNNDLFTNGEKDQHYEFSKAVKPPLNLNCVAGLFILYSVFSLFALSSVSVFFSLGIDTGLLPIIVAIMLSAAVGITTFTLSYVCATTFE